MPRVLSAGFDRRQTRREALRITYDPEADALYLYLRPKAGEDGAAAEAVEIAPNVNADYTDVVSDSLL